MDGAGRGQQDGGQTGEGGGGGGGAAAVPLGYIEIKDGTAVSAYNPFTPPTRPDGAMEDLITAAVNAATTAWSRVDPSDPAVRTPLPPVPTLTAELAAVACATDAAVHSWDVATATGQGSPLTSALAAQLMAAARATVEPLRGFAYAPALPAQPGDDSVDTLLRYLGRDPNWSA